ncbi:unnamed protein product [Moneuplotes crassus]|uniref:Serine/threonine-protein phosphatase 4 regulatory subunit 3-like central domain-containing protein n=1 Tax=Euplotes crassus TaxID=5936 RepID=A0AAD2D4R6_EUPCR|nr:unnamed protein product [Moneuplotes crassus]
MASNTENGKEINNAEAGKEIEEEKQAPMVEGQDNQNGDGQVAEHKKWRAKLYQLNADGGWDDLGTGHCHVDVKQEIIKLTSESDETELLDSRISLSTSYHRQRDTIITWLDDSTQMDLAISFQEIDGAQETWEIICNIQGKDPEEVSQEDESDDEFLPEPDCSKLGSIHSMLQIMDLSRKQKVIEDILKDDEEYIKKLEKVFVKAEEEKNEECLKEVFLVFKDLINISDVKLLETLVSDKYYLTLFGALEYNNEISNTHSEMKHREFLKNKVKFKTFIAINDKEVIQKIHENYRISYLKDTALATGLDENNMQTINNLVSSNNQTLIQSILLDQENITQIFESLKNDSLKKRREAISFISELFSISKNLQIQGRLNLLSSFRNIEGYNLLIFVLESINLNASSKEEGKNAEKEIKEEMKCNHELVSDALEILMSYLQSFPVTLNELCESYSQSESAISSERFLAILVEHMLETKEQDLKLQVHEFLKFLLDSGDTTIIGKFYNIGLRIIADYFDERSDEPESNTNNNVSIAKSLGLDIIIKTITEDHYNCKSSILSLDLIGRVAKLIEFNNKLLNIGVIKFYKALLATNFKPYGKKMIEDDSLDCVIKIYSELKNKKNMIGSIVLDLFSKITKFDYNELASHLCKKYEIVKPFLQKCADKYDQKNIDSIHGILTKLDKNEEGDKCEDDCFKRSPKFGIGMKTEDFGGMDTLKDKSVEEIKEEFDLSKPPINPIPENTLDFTPNFDKDIKLETDEVLNEDMIEPAQESKSKETSETETIENKNEGNSEKFQLNIQQENVDFNEKEVSTKKRDLKAAEKHQEGVKDKEESTSPVVQNSTNPPQEPPVVKDSINKIGKGEHKKQKTEEEDAKPEQF